MINIVNPSKSGSKSHIFLNREPRTNDPVTLCGRDIHTDPTRPNPAAVGQVQDITDAFCKTCVKHWNATAEYRAQVNTAIAFHEAMSQNDPGDWLDEFIPDVDIDAYDITESDIIPLVIRPTHGQVKHERDRKREAMKRRVKIIMGN